MEFLGEVRDRSVRTPELLQNAASGGVRERGERGIAGLAILNHMVQYITQGLAACKRNAGSLSAAREGKNVCSRLRGVQGLSGN